MKIDFLHGRTIGFENKEYLYCSGTDYLGMAYNSKLKEAINEGYNQFGLNYGSTRKHGLFEDIYAAAEHRFAQMVGLESGLTVSSGTLAGQLVRNTAKALSYGIIEAPRLHPALKDIVRDMIAPRIEEQQNSFLEDILHHPSDKIAILIVAVDPLTVELARLDFLDQVQEKEVMIIIDDTHGLGVLGEDGGGYLSLHPQLYHHNIVLISSLAKGMALPGGLICGPKDFVDTVRNSGHFAGSSPISPAYLQAFIRSQEEYQKQRIQLRNNMDTFFENLDPRIDLHRLHNFPIFLLKDPQAGELLKSKGVWISSIRYPYPHSELLNRIILNGVHQSQDIHNICEILHQSLIRTS